MPIGDRKLKDQDSASDGGPKRKHVATGRPRGGRLVEGIAERVYRPELADEICNYLALGKTLREIERMPHMPSRTAVRLWAIHDVDGFASRYARAREAQMEEWSDEIIEISNNEKLDPHDRRVRIDTRKWLMSKLAPKRYGDKLTLASDPSAPLYHVRQ